LLAQSGRTFGRQLAGYERSVRLFWPAPRRMIAHRRHQLAMVVQEPRKNMPSLQRLCTAAASIRPAGRPIFVMGWPFSCLDEAERVPGPKSNNVRGPLGLLPHVRKPPRPAHGPGAKFLASYASRSIQKMSYGPREKTIFKFEVPTAIQFLTRVHAEAGPGKRKRVLWNGSLSGDIPIGGG
jgi:hypothetical protein